jgi:release factor glutamine methyltransferase
MTSIHDSLIAARSRSEPLEAELLLMHILQCSRSFLYAHGNEALTPEQSARFNALIEQRIEGMPIAYLIGSREFWSLPLHVTPATLIPRPETELLVEIILTTFSTRDDIAVLELGCGSGAIALALAHSHPHWSITATDFSPDALAIAQLNAKQLGINNISWIQSDWFTAIPAQLVDCIVSNPPYIAQHDPHLHQGDLRFEPLTALASGPDGLDAIRELITSAPHYLKPSGCLILEHGYQQAPAVAHLLHARGFEDIHCTLDWQGHPRVTQAYFKGTTTHMTK